MDSTPFIFVLGVPSGGTSCVAEIVRRLGVDMGRTPRHNAPHGRNYPTCEDGQFFADVVNSHCSWGRPVPQSDSGAAAGAVARYVHRRRMASDADNAIGCKGWVNWATTSSEFWNIPNLWVLRVHRPLEECIASFLRYQRRAKGANSEKDLVRIAAYVAGLWTMAFQMQPSQNRIYSVEYRRLRRNPARQVQLIADWLPIEVSEERIGLAIRHVR